MSRFVTTLVVALSLAPAAGSAEPPDAAAALARLPLAFIPNTGQTHSDVFYHVKGSGPDAYVMRDGIVYVQAPDERGAGSVIRVRVQGADPRADVEPMDRLPGTVSFHLGRDPEAWRIGLPTWAGVAQRSLLPGVDMLWSGKDGRLKSDIVFAPGADPSAVRLIIEGAECVSLGAGGALHVGTLQGDIVEQPPVAWQRGAVEGPVEARFVLLGADVVGFEVSGRDPRAELVIDPVMDFASFFGGSGDDVITSMNGVAGRTRSPDFPTVVGPFLAPIGNWDAFLAGLDLSSSGVTWCTYFGGSGDETVVDASSSDLLGTTTSPDLPLAGTPWDSTLGGSSDVYWAQFPGHVLAESTYWGGSGADEALGADRTAATDGAFCGRTTSPDLPTMLGPTPPGWTGPYQAGLSGPSDGFVAWMSFWGGSGTGGDYIAASYIGGSGHDEATGVRFPTVNQELHVIGRTWSADFPTHATAHDRTLDGASDAFIAEWGRGPGPAGSENPFLQTLAHSTLLGGAGEDAATDFVVAENVGANVGMAGWTDSADFPLRSSILPGPARGVDAFVTTFDDDYANIELSTLFGGSGDEGPGIRVGEFLGHVTLAGTTTSADLPMRLPLQDSLRGPSDVFVATLNLASLPPRIEWSTYLGGSGDEELHVIASDTHAKCIRLGGGTDSLDLPTLRAIQPVLAGGQDGLYVRVCETDVLGQRPVEVVLPDILEQLEEIEDRIEACDCAAIHDALESLQESAAEAAEDHAEQAETLEEILEAIADLAARIDALELDRLADLELQIERALFARDCVPWIWLPEAHGGRLEIAMALVQRRLDEALAAGASGVNERVARDRLADAARAATDGEPQRACRSLCDALHALTMP